MKHEAWNIKQQGFSLIELVVVLAISSVITIATVDIFISVVQNQKRILEEQELLSQTSFAMEYMSNSLRMAAKDPTGSCLGASGRIYLLTHCPLPGQPCNGVKFINTLDNNACEELFLDTSVNIINPPLRQIKNNLAAQNLLSSKLKLKYGNFVINGDKTLRTASASDLIQPRITWVLDVLTASNQSEKILQTTVSQRNFDLDTLPPSGSFCNPFNQCVSGGSGVSCNPVVNGADCICISGGGTWDPFFNACSL